MTQGADASSLRHFIVKADGTLWSFAPGGSLQQVQGMNHVKAIAAFPKSFDIVVLKDNGTVWMWGDNDDGQLGNPAFKGIHTDKPMQVPGIHNAIAVSMKSSASYALLSDGTIMAWGRISPNGRSAYIEWPKPTRLPGITNAIALSGAMALCADGSIWAWGSGCHGRLGNGTTTSTKVPVKVKGIKNAVVISSREDGGAALLADGSVWTWGYSFNGELGNGNTPVSDHGANGVYSTIPIRVKGIAHAVAISAVDNTCFALLQDGTVMGWGDGRLGGLIGHRQHVNKTPFKLPLHDVAAIRSGNFCGFALLEDGTLLGWGSDMVKTGSYNQTYKPVVIAKLGNEAPVK